MTEQQGDGHGNGERRTLVFLHGSGDSAQLWSQVIALLGDRGDLRCVALDLPGHGSLVTRPGPADMTLDDYADAVRSAITRDALGPVTLIGHSLGSAITLRLALEQPALVRRIVLVGGGARLRVLPSLLDGAKNATSQTMEQMVIGAFAPGHEREAFAYASRMAPSAQGMLYRDLAACNGFDMMADLGRIAQPALILVGSADQLTPPKYAQYLADHLEQATLVTVPNAGHYLPVEAPEAVARAIGEWLGK